MKFGVNILNFGPHATPEALAGWARFAEEAGFDFAMISDHVAVTPDVAEQYPAPFYDPFTVLAWLAGTTERIALGTTVAVLPYRHPLQLARVTANLDRLSGGRLIFGVGVGWSKREYAALNVPFEQRGPMTDRALDVVLRSWTQDSVSYGDETIDPRPHPVQKPHPPVWVGGRSPGALRRAARFGDAWHPINVTPAALRTEGLPALRRAAEEAGRPVPALAPRIRLDDVDEALRQAEGFAELGATHLLLDTYPGTPDLARPPEEDQRMLAAFRETF
ncbi:TIGR03619 family F420-dependent LLM class oxidoreductase [Actinomadura sp. WMMB 499]|uniref:TIGR03619 family F420-dependent LLM class oxidoreductase n=1 Tax=Actinomadura sp. WMMB 499 TaxID=1219491 RepID=UPI0012479DA2|nr:TIGR03619 family F420-dependent LLM class oxidoreductase [Actinomadura sp. WMMB 499]QFG20740.1 TIGR03619 family F420-dependent LLM class oxidoreductase [Actinomadura sp. WMMB 499]